jgi:hypothetical protein
MACGAELSLASCNSRDCPLSLSGVPYPYGL